MLFIKQYRVCSMHDVGDMPY